MRAAQGFTDQRAEDTAELLDYNARWYDQSVGRFVSPDSIVPGAGNPQALNRYAYALGNPLKYTDPSGHCAGIFSWVRGLPGYATTCDNLGMAQDIAHDSRASLDQKAFAVLYIGTEVTAHAAVVVGAALATCGTIGPCVAAAQSTAAAGTAVASYACGDGDCTNEARSAQEATRQGISLLGRYPDYVEQAKAYGYNLLNIPKAEWDALSKTEQWARNVQFLKERVAAGDIFRIAESIDDVLAGELTFLKRELEFLFANGYEIYIDANGANWMIKGVPPSPLP